MSSERRQAAGAILESETRFSDLLKKVPLVLLSLDRDGYITYCNEYLLGLTGQRRGEVIGRSWFDLLVPRGITPTEDFAALLAGLPDDWHGENELLTRSGDRLLMRWTHSVLRSDSGDVTGTATIGEDITGPKRAELRIRRLNRLYAVLSGINTLIVRVRSRAQLFNEACRIAVGQGSFSMAWIGSVDAQTLDGKVVAWFGGEEGYVESVRLTARDGTPDSRHPACRALRESQPVLCNDIATDSSVAPLREELLQRGYRSLACLPLFVAGRPAAVIALFAGEPDVFDAEEMRLLRELAGDISFALENLATQEKIARLNRVEAFTSEINSLIVRIGDRQHLFREVCRVAVEHGEFPTAWIGAYDAVAAEATPVAWAPAGADDSASARDTQRIDVAGDNGVVARAIREKRPAFQNNLKASALGQTTLEVDAVGQGSYSIIALPLLVEDSVVAHLSLFANEKDFFTDAEVKVLSELAGNISFALEAIGKEEKIARLSRIQAVTGNINALIVRAKSRQELFDDACRIAIEHGQLGIAWIGLLDKETLDVTPVAWSGEGAEALKGIKSSALDGSVSGNGGVGRAIRQRELVFNNNVSAYGFGGPRRKEVVALGFKSQITLPLYEEETVIGTLTMYARESDFFNEEERKLLSQLAGDLSFALDHILKGDTLAYLAYHDALTGLANHGLFLERVTRHMRSAASGEELALFLVDLERFKNINDSLGQSAGDALLQQVAEWLTGNTNDVDLLARVSGNQFAVVCPHVKNKDAIALRLEATMERFHDHKFHLADSVFRIGAKVGVALFPVDGTDAGTLFRNAEAALKKAKTRGDRYLFYTQTMSETVAGKLTLENQLRKALDNQEFVLHYQPKVNLRTGVLTGAEALIRWNDPRSGLAPPDRFLPVLEETGMIHEVGRWAMRKAAEDYQRWVAAGLNPVRISVNVSPRQLRSRGFIAEVEAAVGVDEGAPAGLELEITESVIMEDIKLTISILQAIRAMGVTVAIDDFGTGLSALSCLSRLPIDALKIHRSFLDEMTNSRQGLSMVSTIINLGHSFKLGVVADGVETEEQSRLLRLLDCDETQGFLLSRPLPGEVFEARFLATPPIPEPALRPVS